MNKVWHKREELPEDGDEIMVLFREFDNEDTMIQENIIKTDCEIDQGNVFLTEYEELDWDNCVIAWAYPEDVYAAIKEEIWGKK